MKKQKTSILDTLKKNKRIVYIFLGVIAIVLMIYVFLFPVSDNSTKANLISAASKFKSNQGIKYNPQKIEFNNVSFDSKTAKVYRFRSNEESIVQRLITKISGLTLERSDSSLVTVLYSPSYRFNYNKNSKTLSFDNKEQSSSKFDGMNENNALNKLTDVLGFDFNLYQKLTSRKNIDNTVYVNYSLTFDGVVTDLPDGRNGGLEILISPDGKLKSFYWTVTEIEESVQVKLMNSKELQDKFSTLNKYFYRNTELDQKISTGVSQGVEVDTSNFAGDIQVTSATLVYFNQSADTTYIVPTYKLKAKFIQGDKQTDGFIYVVAYNL